MRLFEKEIIALRDYLESNNNIVLITHKDPDGDAIGSAMAWCRSLAATGKNPVIITPDQIPGNLKWIQNNDYIIEYDSNPELAATKLQAASLIIFLDFNSLSRTGRLIDLLKSLKTPRVVIDHHPFPEDGIARLVICDTSVSSTCELSYTILEMLNMPVCEKVAEAIYTGIISDTGMLGHNSSNPYLYRVVARLLEAGLDKEKVHRELFHNYSLGRLQLMGYCLYNKMEILPSGKVALIALTVSELDQFQYQPGDLEGIVNIPLSIGGVEVSTLVTERPGDIVKLSFRSKGQFPVNGYSNRYFSGGGHLNAAGGQFRGKVSGAVELFKQSVEGYFGW